MSWDVRIRRSDGSDKIETGLSTEQVRTALYSGSLRGEDLARPAPGAAWRELAWCDEFCDHVPDTERRAGRHRDAEEEGLDMTPMIDMTFLLLIFFMVTATFHLQKGLDFPGGQTETEPPSPSQADPLPGLPAFDDRLVVEINALDEFRFKDARTGVSGAPIEGDELEEKLREKSRSEKLGKLLILPHESSSHEATVAVIDASAQAGVVDISIADTTNQSLSVGTGPPKMLQP